MSDYATVAAGFSDRLAGVADWSARTPCDGWDVRELAAHVIDTHHRVLSLLDGGQPPVLDAASDVTAGWAAAQGSVLAALSDGRGQTVVQGFLGSQPFAELVGTLLCADTLLHTWDLSRATGQDDTLDAGAVAGALAFLTPMDEGMRRPGGFGPRVDVAADAGLQDQLVAFTGRRP